MGLTPKVVEDARWWNGLGRKHVGGGEESVRTGRRAGKREEECGSIAGDERDTGDYDEHDSRRGARGRCRE